MNNKITSKKTNKVIDKSNRSEGYPFETLQRD